MPAQCFLQLGSNLGNRIENLNNAIELIKTEIGPIVSFSSIYESEPWGYEDDRSYLNQVVLVSTEFTPQQTLENCLEIENILGRKRSVQSYEARTMDIDVLFYKQDIIQTKSLTVPHPRLHLRKFVLEPLKEIAPELIHPEFGKTISELYTICSDSGKVWKTKNPSTEKQQKD